MAATLVSVYVLFGFLGGDFLSLNFFVALPFAQVNQLVWEGWVWMLFTAMFLHADLVHLSGNVLFLLVFGTSLEEQVSRTRWWLTYFGSGLAGNLAFLFLGPFLGQGIAVGASGAIWGLLGAAGGVKGVMAVLIFLGFDIFAGGGVLAHVGGLFMGLFLRTWWDDIVTFVKGSPPELSGRVGGTSFLGGLIVKRHCVYRVGSSVFHSGLLYYPLDYSIIVGNSNSPNVFRSFLDVWKDSSFY